MGERGEGEGGGGGDWLVLKVTTLVVWNEHVSRRVGGWVGGWVGR